MSFKQAVSSVFHNYANFSGRARRSEYWYFVLFNLIVGVVLGIIDAILGENSLLATAISGLYSLAVLVPSLAVCWRRLHDIGKSGAWWLLVFVPLVGAIILVIWFAKDTQPGENQYGPDPKNPTEKIAPEL